MTPLSHLTPEAATDALFAVASGRIATPPLVATPIRPLNADLWAIHAKPAGALTADDWRVLEEAEAAGLNSQSKDASRG